MASLPVEFLFGIYLGLLTGIVPAFVSGSLGFAFKYLTGVTLPGLGVVVLGVAIAGINGGLMGLLDPAVASSPRVVTATVVVMMLSLYAHSQGDKLGETFPKRFSLRRLRERTLSGDVLDVFGGVTVTVTGTVGDVEGYPPLPADLRERLRESTWTFPGDLPLSELEARLADRLRTEFDLADVSVTVDSRGRATVAAAPPTGNLSKRVPPGKRAVSVRALLPTGLARGDRVVATTLPATGVASTTDAAGTTDEAEATDAAGPIDEAEATDAAGPIDEAEATDEASATDVTGTTETMKSVSVTATVVSAGSTDDDPPEARASPDMDVATDGGADEEAAAAAAPVAPTTTGGEGRVTLAVDRSDADALLRADRVRVRVLARGTHREYELVSLLRRAGSRFRRVTVRSDGALDGTTIGAASVRDTYEVAIVAVRRPQTATESDARRAKRDGDVGNRWRFSPHGDVALAAGDELFVVGRASALTAFVEATA